MSKPRRRFLALSAAADLHRWVVVLFGRRLGAGVEENTTTRRSAVGRRSTVTRRSTVAQWGVSRWRAVAQRGGRTAIGGVGAPLSPGGDVAVGLSGFSA